MKTKLWILLLVFAMLTLAACSRLVAAERTNTSSPQKSDAARDCSATSDTQFLNNESHGYSAAARDSGPVSGDERSNTERDETPAPKLDPLAVSQENQGLARNPFEILLGPIRVPYGSSVRLCPGGVPLLCIFQGKTALGTLELVTLPLAQHLDFQKVLSDAGIPLGSVDYTDPQYAPQERAALAVGAEQSSLGISSRVTVGPS